MSNHPRRSTSRPWAPTAPPSAPFVLPEAGAAPPSTPPPPSAAEIIAAVSAAVAEPGPAGVSGLITRLAATPGWVARAALAVVARLTLEPADRELASLEVRARDEPLPAWVERFDDVVLSAVVQLRDPLGDADTAADQDRSGPAWTWDGERLDRLAGQVGSRATLASLDVTPLPDEPFTRDGILPEVLPAVDAILVIVDDVCDRFFDIELRTAARRLLAKLARRSGTVVRHGRCDTTAAGIVWLVATANRAFDRHGVRQKDVRAHLRLSSALSSRAHTLGRVLTGGRARWQDGLGDAGLLTSAHRRWLVAERDRLLEEQRVLTEAIGW